MDNFENKNIFLLGALKLKTLKVPRGGGGGGWVGGGGFEAKVP